MSLNLKIIGDDATYGEAVIREPLNENYIDIKNQLIQNSTDITTLLAGLSLKVNLNDVYTIGNLNSQDIINNSLMAGSTVKVAIDGIHNTFFTIGSVDTNVIEDKSTLNNNTLTVTLDEIKTLLDNIIVGGSNDEIGIYQLSDLVNTNDYVSSYTDLSLYNGLTIILDIANINNGNSTLDISDGNGIKNIKYYDGDTKQLLLGNELKKKSILYYDGIDWVNLSYSFKIGNLNNLTTDDKTNAVNSINEINGNSEFITNNDSATINQKLVHNGDGTATFKDINLKDNILRSEIEDFKVQLAENDVADFSKKGRVGFYDIFDSVDYVDGGNTTATVSTVNEDVTFAGSQQLQMDTQTFKATASEVDIILYSKTENTVKVNADVIDNNVINIDDELSIGDKLWTGEVNEVTDVVEVDDSITYDYTTPVQVVNEAYSTQGNGGRKIVRLDNGWIVSVNHSGITAYFQVSKDNGNTWEDLCYRGSVESSISLSLVSIGNNILFTFENPSSNTIYFGRFDATQVSTSSDLNTQPSYTYPEDVLDSSQTSFNGVSLAINQDNTKITATWSSKNSTYPDSFNIRAIQGTISGGVVTWGSVEQLSTRNESDKFFISPSVIYNNDNNPVILCIQNFGGSYYVQSYDYNGSVWTIRTVYAGSSYTQSNPSATFMPPEIATKIDSAYTDGLIIVTWEGEDSTTTSGTKIKCKASSDNGVTWFDFGKVNEDLTDSTVYDNVKPSVTWNNLGYIFVMFEGASALSSGNPSLRLIERDTNSWGDIQEIDLGVVSPANYPTNPSSCDNYHKFEKPITIFMKTGDLDVKFYGKWTVGSTTYDITLTHNVTVSSSDLIPQLDYKAYINNSEATLLDYNSTTKKLFYNVNNINNSDITLKVEGKDIVLDNINYSFIE